MNQPKIEFELIQKFINLKNWCNKKFKQEMKKKLREREWKLCIEWKKKSQIYSKMLRTIRVKIKENKKVEKEWYYGRK